MITVTSITEVSNHLQGLKAVIFDLDDTLYSEKEYVRSGYRAIAAILPQVERMEEKLWQAFEQKKSAIDEVLRAEGLYTEELKQQCLSVYRFHQPNIHFYNGTKELLIQLRSDGYKLGIITDGRPEGQRAKIKALGLDELVDCIIVTDELGGIEFRKPCIMAFEQMQRTMDVPFKKMVYVGDNTKKDFMAPEKLGMRSLWFNNDNGIYCE
ncbi:MAG: HAD family hydrolase [Ruminococcaceae bacterium]|nr:HAD family hydrolase [Oscillospiraceae bacterium]